MRYLIIDTFNLIHRARGGYQKGEYPIVFNFFRGLRPLVEMHPADELVFVLEGRPKGNIALLPEYKANRTDPGPDFHRQKDEVIRLLRSLSCRIFWHPDFEADDVIGAVVSMFVRPDDEALQTQMYADGAPGDVNAATIISTDSDFNQLLRPGRDDVRLWNWRDRAMVPPPDFDYVRWKALRGDPTDNVPRVPGMDDATALVLAKDAIGFDLAMQDPVIRGTYERNEGLIRLHRFSPPEVEDLLERSTDCLADWDELRLSFERFGFRSMLKEPTWTRYVETFSGL